jgi:hypothetical protein
VFDEEKIECGDVIHSYQDDGILINHNLKDKILSVLVSDEGGFKEFAIQEEEDLWKTTTNVNGKVYEDLLRKEMYGYIFKTFDDRCYFDMNVRRMVRDFDAVCGGRYNY